jgi:apolipoprotein N-acyltransferase
MKPKTTSTPTTRRVATAAASIGAGVVLAGSLPPWGFWPLAVPGLLIVDRLIAHRPARSRFVRGLGVGLGLLGPSMLWMKDLTAPGYVIAVAFFAVGIGVAAALCPPGAGRHLALPAAWVLAEAFRGVWPFGGVPMSILAVGQVAGPLGPVARVGGTLLVAGVTVTAGVCLSALVDRRWFAAVGAAGVVVLALVVAGVAPSGKDTRTTLRVGFVQGGGPQGTHDEDTDPTVVFNRHHRESLQLPKGLDLVIWPEDVVDTRRPVEQTRFGDRLAQLAVDLRTTLIAGVVEDVGRTKFTNASVAWNPKGEVVGRYEKVHRVPFGEYVPLRSLVEPFAGDTLTQRDAIIGTGPPVLDVAGTRVGVMISWEVFFGSRGRAATRHGGTLLINPTNGSSYTGTMVQTQQVASSRLRALENGRWVVQAAPTGFSAFITPSGKVIGRTSVSEATTGVHVVALRSGETIYTRVGDRPIIAAAALLVAVAWLLDRRGRQTADPG